MQQSPQRVRLKKQSRDSEKGKPKFEVARQEEAKNFRLTPMNKKQIENAVSQYAINFPHYSKNAQAVIFEGRFIEKNANSEGDVFQPFNLVGIVKF